MRDTEKGLSDFVPFKNLFNEWFAKDTSRKVKAAFKQSLPQDSVSAPMLPSGTGTPGNQKQADNRRGNPLDSGEDF